MQLSDRALQALIDIRRELLSRDVVQATPIELKKEKPRPQTFRGHHPKQTNAYQRGCQNRRFWSPVH